METRKLDEQNLEAKSKEKINRCESFSVHGGYI